MINPKSLVKELAYLHEEGVTTDSFAFQIAPMSSSLTISNWTVSKKNLKETTRSERRLKGLAQPIWTKLRVGIRIADLLDRDVFAERLRINLEEKNRQFTKLYDAEALSFDDIFEEYYEYGQQIKQYVTDTSVILNDALDNGKRVLFEGAQGVMLDIDQGTYPFVTSSNPVAGGVTIGSGVGPSKIDKVVGVCKAYTSRVGDGPFPTELFDEVGDRIREVGHEYGTTTGRPSSCWLV